MNRTYRIRSIARVEGYQIVMYLADLEIVIAHTNTIDEADKLVTLLKKLNVK